MTLKQRMSILGQHISLVRPVLVKKQRIFKNELPAIKYDKKPKTNEIDMAEFLRVCISHDMVKED